MEARRKPFHVRCRALVLTAVAAVLAGCSTTDYAVAALRADLVIENVTVYDGLSPQPIVATVAIRDGVFTAIDTPGARRYDARENIDGAGLYLVPGLWDAHVHLRSSRDGGLDVQQFLRHGVTSVRDAGGYPDRLLTLQAEIATGTVAAPTIYPSHLMLNGQSFDGFQRVVATREEIAATIDEVVAAGAAQVKVHRALAPDLLGPAVELTHARGLPLIGHIPLGMHPLDACRAGMDDIQHVGSLSEALLSLEPGDTRDWRATVDYLLSPEADPLYACLVQHGTAVTPTLVIYPTIARRRAPEGALPAEFREFIAAMGKVTLRLFASGVTLLAGTDTSDLGAAPGIVPGASLLDELELLEAAGIPAAEIIGMATANVAHLAGAHRSGRIEVGARADFLLLRDDPGSSARAFRNLVRMHKAP